MLASCWLRHFYHVNPNETGAVDVPSSVRFCILDEDAGVLTTIIQSNYLRSVSVLDLFNVCSFLCQVKLIMS